MREQVGVKMLIIKLIADKFPDNESFTKFVEELRAEMENSEHRLFNIMYQTTPTCTDIGILQLDEGRIFR
jgi:hypothetical protein